MTNVIAPKVTVIVAVLNASETIGQCLSSIIEQSSKSVELVVIDGGSTDGTKEIVESYGNLISYFASGSDSGVYEAFNKGVAASSGEWLMFLGADDYLYNSSSIEKILNFIEIYKPQQRIIYGQILVEDIDGKKELFGKSWSESKSDFRNFMSIPHVGMFHHKSVFMDKGSFDESFRVAGDYELVYRELSSSDALFVPGVIVAEHRFGGLSTNPNFGLVVHMELWRARRQNGKLFPGFYWLVRLPRVLFLPVMIVLFGQERGRNLHQGLKNLMRKSSPR